MDVSELFPGNTQVDEAPSMAIYISLAAFAFFLTIVVLPRSFLLQTRPSFQISRILRETIQNSV
jgi:hypothetical protein